MYMQSFTILKDELNHLNVATQYYCLVSQYVHDQYLLDAKKYVCRNFNVGVMYKSCRGHLPVSKVLPPSRNSSHEFIQPCIFENLFA